MLLVQRATHNLNVRHIYSHLCKIISKHVDVLEAKCLPLISCVGVRQGVRPDLIDLLFLGSSCTLIIKKNWKKIKQTDFFFLVNSFSKKSLHSHTFFFFLPVFCFIFIPI